MTNRILKRIPSLPLIVAVGLIVWAWYRLEFFTTSRIVFNPDGSVSRWPNALATVDHPFHASRYSTFMDALRDGSTPRWVFQHQGGYPSEFYPFGSAVMDLFVWCLTLGQGSVPIIHTWAVAWVFALPTLGFMVIPRLCGFSPWVGVVGIAAHMCIRGWWWSGGSYELIDWGLITNVLAASLVFTVLVLVAAYLEGRSPRLLGLAGLLVGWSIWTNPRSAIALLTIAAASIIVVLASRPGRASIRTAALVAIPFALGIGLSIPLIASLVRYNDLYFFVHYSGYLDVRSWFDSSIQAVSGPVFGLALIGLVRVFAAHSSAAERLIGWTTILYLALTWWLIVVDWPGGSIEQLETTRLMPFQRLLMIALACIALGRLAQLLAPRWRSWAVAAVAGSIPVLYVISPPSFIPESDRGLDRVGSMAQPGLADLHSAVEVADASAPDSTSMLILGTTDYWHDQMWATLWTDRLLFYDDWLWYWQQEHVGVYDPVTEHAYPDDASALDPDYLRVHGIGSVIVSGQAEEAARTSPDLTMIRDGMYSVYLVNSAVATATIEGQSVGVTISENAITIESLPESGGELLVRVNWFPRWHAQADGQSLAITHGADGYMTMYVPAGVSRLELRYARTGLDWITLVTALGSALVAMWLIVYPPCSLRAVDFSGQEPGVNAPG